MLHNYTHAALKLSCWIGNNQTVFRKRFHFYSEVVCALISCAIWQVLTDVWAYEAIITMKIVNTHVHVCVHIHKYLCGFEPSLLTGVTDAFSGTIDHLKFSSNFFSNEIIICIVFCLVFICNIIHLRSTGVFVYIEIAFWLLMKLSWHYKDLYSAVL